MGEVPTGEDSLPVPWRLQDCAMISYNKSFKSAGTCSFMRRNLWGTKVFQRKSKCLICIFFAVEVAGVSKYFLSKRDHSILEEKEVGWCLSAASVCREDNMSRRSVWQQ